MTNAIAPRLEAAPTQERIKTVAATLYVLRGYEGFSFADIADEIGTTRANIHHHFGNKRRLVDELIEQFAGDAVRRIERLWLGTATSFADRLTAQLEDLRRFYVRFNGPGDRNVWSPLSRLRHDLSVLGKPAISALERADDAYKRALPHALRLAVSYGEFSPATPVDDISGVLRVLLFSCPPMTQDTGSFEGIERLFTSIDQMLIRGWSNVASGTK